MIKDVHDGRRIYSGTRLCFPLHIVMSTHSQGHRNDKLRLIAPKDTSIRANNSVLVGKSHNMDYLLVVYFTAY